MATDLTTGLNEDLVRSSEVANVDEPLVAGTEVLARNKPGPDPVTDALKDDTRREEGLISSSSYALASDQSLYSSQVDSWLRGGLATTENIGVQYSRMPFAQRPTLTPTPTLDPSGLWYLMAMILPFFSANSSLQWSWCTPENVMNAGIVLVAQVSRFCHDVRGTVRRLADEQIARDLFATIMDIVLIIYAIGFLALSLYQASFFG